MNPPSKGGLVVNVVTHSILSNFNGVTLFNLERGIQSAVPSRHSTRSFLTTAIMAGLLELIFEHSVCTWVVSCSGSPCSFRISNPDFSLDM